VNNSGAMSFSGKRRAAILAACAAAVSISLGVLLWQFVSLEPGLDMPWMPSKLLGQGLDPYLAYLNPSDENPTFLAQIPNMLHGTYVMFIPFGFLDWEWAKTFYALTNLLLASLLLWRVQRIFALLNWEFLIVATLFLTSIPFRVTVYNGQFSLIALVGVLLFIEKASIARSIALGVALLKYSFAFPIAFLILLKKNMRKRLALIALPAVTGLLVFHLMFSSRTDYSLLQMAVAPLQVALVGTGLGASDAYSMFRLFVPEASSLALVGVLVVIALTGFFSAMLIRHLDLWSQISLLSLMSLATLPHLIYDYVFLLPLVAHLVRIRDSKLCWLVLPTVLWHWFAYGPFQTVAVSLGWGELISMGIGAILNALALTGLFLQAKSSLQMGNGGTSKG